jgi:hypothetical protein
MSESFNFGKMIETSEKAGQADLVNTEKLPRSASGGPLGGWDLLKEWGVQVLEEVDDLFYAVTLPTGWSKQATGHSMHSDLCDEKGRKRASIFYKAAFYDRDANISPIISRFDLTRIYDDKDVIQFAVTDRARDTILHHGVPVRHAYKADEPGFLGAISGEKFWLDVIEGSRRDMHEFAYSLPAHAAIPLRRDDLYRMYDYGIFHKEIDAAENLAQEGLYQWIRDFLNGRDQWEVE